MTKRQIPTLTVGIPAYNEEVNIERLLCEVLSQKLNNIVLKQVTVSSDGSTDDTVKISKSLKDRRIKVIANCNRRGIARGLNQIIKKATGDILVTLDADIKISDQLFLQKLVDPIISDNVDLTSSAIKELSPTSFFSKIIYVSMQLKNILFLVFKKGQNIYNCKGLARGYSQKFYSRLQFPVSVGNDMYSYLFCLSRSFNYRYVSKSAVNYRLPQTWDDHQKQSMRFFSSPDQMAWYFDPEFVKNQLFIPFYVYIIAATKALQILVKYPLESLAYFFIQLFLKIKSVGFRPVQTWVIAASSKTI